LLHDARSTFVVAEGVLMYLPPATAHALLEATLPALSPRAVRILFSYMASPGFRPASRAVQAWLRWRGEPFRWLAEPSALEAALRAKGLHLDAHLPAPFDDGAAADTALRGENLMEVSAGGRPVPSRAQDTR
jgi:O-methyltransferase involved in polyketide biosynthesis